VDDVASIGHAALPVQGLAHEGQELVHGNGNLVPGGELVQVLHGAKVSDEGPRHIPGAVPNVKVRRIMLAAS